MALNVSLACSVSSIVLRLNIFAPKTGANVVAPKIGAMQNIRLSIYSSEHVYLRHILTQRRLALGLSQRALAERLNVVHSVIGKIETGDRRLDVFEFVNIVRNWNLIHLKCCKK